MVLVRRRIPALPGEVWSKIAEFMTPKMWASGLGCTCKALHRLGFERLQLSLLEESIHFDQNQDCKYPVYLGLKWMSKHFPYLKVLDFHVSCDAGLLAARHRIAMESDVLALREGDGPRFVMACRVAYRQHSGVHIQDLLDWMLARMGNLKFLDVDYHYAVFPAVYPALSNVKCLRIMMNDHLEAREISPELLLLPNLEELSISDHGIVCNYDVEDEFFTAKNYPEEYDLRKMAALQSIGFEGITTGAIRLPPNCRALVQTQKMDLDRALYMQKLNDDLAEIWVYSKKQVHHFVQTNESPTGFDMGFLPHLSCVRCLEFHGSHARRPGDWPNLDHFSVDLTAFQLPFLESLRILYSSDECVTVNVALPCKLPLKCLEVSTTQVMLSIESPEALGDMLEKLAILGSQLQSNVDMEVLWGRLRMRGFTCAMAEGEGYSMRCWYTRKPGEGLLDYEAACELPSGCRCGLCFNCWSVQGRVKLHR